MTTSWNEASRALSNGKRLRSADSLLVIFGDQLDPGAPILNELDPKRDAILMMEVAEEAEHVPSHRQRTALFLAAMRHHALHLIDRGFRVRYITLDDDDNTHSFDSEFKRAADTLNPKRILVTHPGEHRVMKMVEGWSKSHEVQVRDDPHFYCSIEEFADWAEGRKQLTMEYFYREMRRKHDVLMTKQHKPVGGEWNFDKQNREAFKSTPRPPAPYKPRPDDITRAAMQSVENRWPDAYGRMDSLIWPVTREEALRALKMFIEERLPRFGTHQDAMWTGEPFLYHSHLSTSLNLKLLNPRECVAAAVDAYDNNKAPINSVEGFVRQLLGWREFIRGVYWLEGPSYLRRNALRQNGSLPDFYWTAETDMNCMRNCISEVLDNAFGHHIQRLMVTGNFALISGIHPQTVSDWYLGMYADGVDWVTRPNTAGMAMHADGGVVGTKPYSASGAYINRMSNYCDDCRYNPKERTGEDACPFTTFYWDFLIRNRKEFAKNQRMALILKNVDRFSKEERVQITSSASKLRSKMGIAPI